MNRNLHVTWLLALCAAGLLTTAARADQGLTLDPWTVDSPQVTAAPASTRLPGVLTLDEDSSKAAPSPANPLTLKFDLPIWLSGVDGTTGVRGLKIPIHATFDDILKETDSIVGLGGRIEADYGPWIFYGDGLYMKLTRDNIPLGPARLNFISDLTIADLGILYQIGKWNLGASDAAVSVAGGAAGRYMHIGLQLDTARGRSRQNNQDWADPLAAGQVVLDLNKHWQILLRGDVGGGTGADLTWSATALLAYRFAFCDKVSGAVKLGYEALSEDYVSGTGRQQFTWDAVLHGPVVVFSVEF